jgi:hypothetical protein
MKKQQDLHILEIRNNEVHTATPNPPTEFKTEYKYFVDQVVVWKLIYTLSLSWVGKQLCILLNTYLIRWLLVE